MIALTAAALITPTEKIENPVLLLDGGTIREVASRSSRSIAPGAQVFDFAGAVLAPAFIDLHIHGGAGHDVMEADALPAVERLLAEHGVANYVPTTITAPVDRTLSALDRLSQAIEGAGVRDGRARPLGIHMEGPFLSYAKRGVHPAEHLLKPTLEMFERFWQAARGHIRVMTIAPELEGAAEVIKQATRRGVCISIGHSDADFPTARAAVDHGARHATHTFNAMRPLSHRDPGILGEVLTDRRLTADLIADGIHVDPSIVQLFLTAKGREGAVLITDALSATGMPDGRYRLGAFEVEVTAGKCMAHGTLAGSVLTLDRAVRNIMQFAGWELQDSVRLASLNPARVLRIEEAGAIKPGARADIVVLTPLGEVIKTILAGIVE